MLIDGFDTLSAQPNSPNDVITSKSQIIMMIFSVRSIGKCITTNLHRCAYSFEHNSNPVGSCQLIFIVLTTNNTRTIQYKIFFIFSPSLYVCIWFLYYI